MSDQTLIHFLDPVPSLAIDHHAVAGELRAIADRLDPARDDPRTDIAPPLTISSLRATIAARSAITGHFDADLFADPARDLLLDLMLAELARKNVSISSACIAARVPPTTALRWIKLLVERGVIERKPDAKDGRRFFIQLTAASRSAMHRYLGEASAMLRSAGATTARIAEAVR